MSRTTFRNASGLPDPQQVTTARDMAKLAMALLRDFPQYYHYFGVRDFEYNGHVMPNHNRLLGEYPGLDGIKTGYINASGFNLVASAKQNGRRLVGVVFGGKSWRSRNDHMVKLLDEGFLELKERRTQIREASLPSGSAPVPLPPPMVDDVRGVDPAYISRADETDGAEEMVAYSAEDAQKLTAMIDRAQDEDEDAAEDETAAVPIPLPAPRPVLDLNPAGPVTTLESARAAPMVMQLHIPRSQLPAGIPSSQIANNSAPRGWSIQVGAFPSRALTDQALRTAQSRLPAHLQKGRPVIVPQSTGQGLIFRARLQGFDELQANAACAHLGSCLVVAPGS
jgi:D-alanyl-D-alanine carboxypeptidase